MNAHSLFTHHTFEIDQQDVDYFYIKYDKGNIPLENIRVKQDFPVYFMSAFKTEYENKMLTVSLVYKCNPIIKGISPMSLTLEINECGKVTIQWKKSCGDFALPPIGLSVDVKVPKEISNQSSVSIGSDQKNKDEVVDESLIYNGMYTFLPSSSLDIFESVKIGKQKYLSLYVYHDYSDKDLVDLDSFINDVFENMLQNSMDVDFSKNSKDRQKKKQKEIIKQAKVYQ